MAHLAKFGGGVEGKKMYDHWSRATDDVNAYSQEEYDAWVRMKRENMLLIIVLMGAGISTGYAPKIILP